MQLVKLIVINSSLILFAQAVSLAAGELRDVEAVRHMRVEEGLSPSGGNVVPWVLTVGFI